MKPNRLGFEALHNRYVIEGELEPESALHIGSGMPGSETDAAFVRDAKGPYIPGSSLRGVMRSTIERILQALGNERGCVLFATDSHATCLSAMDEKRRKKALEGKTEEQVLELLAGEGQCDVCRLFGSVVLASKLRISDGRPRSNPEMNRRDGVGIDRDTETAREKIKFDFETLERGTVFTFQMQLENATREDFALLGILLTEMTVSGIDVGGKKSRGLGRCKLKCDYKVSYFDNAGEYKLADFLRNGRPDKMAQESFNAMVAEHLNAYLGGTTNVSTTA